MNKLLFIPAICVLCVSCNGATITPTENSNTYVNGTNQSQSSDWEITAQVKKKLMSDNSLSSNARMVSVTTNNGVVVLTGSVASMEERRQVLRIVESVSGVQRIDDQLTVASS